MPTDVVAHGGADVLGDDLELTRARPRPGGRPTRCRRAPCWRCRRRPGGACRGGSASSARRSSARAPRSRRARGWKAVRHAASPCRVDSSPEGYAPARPVELEDEMANFDEIKPRELKPALFELDGISRASIEAHYKLYQGYVNKRNEILGKLDDVDLAAANQVYSELRALKVDLSFAIGGIKNHELYFEHLGGTGGDPDEAIGSADPPRLRLGRRVARRPQGDGDRRPRLGLDRLRLGRAASLQLRRRRPEHVPDLERDPARRARRLRARLLPRLPDRPRVLHRRVPREPGLGRRERLGRGLPDPASRHRSSPCSPATWPGRLPFGYWLVRIGKGVDIRTVGSGNIGRVERLARPTGRVRARRDRCSTWRRASCRPFSRRMYVSKLAGVLAGLAAMLGHARPLFLRFSKGGKMVATGGGAFLGVAPVPGADLPRGLDRRVPHHAVRRPSRRS